MYYETESHFSLRISSHADHTEDAEHFQLPVSEYRHHSDKFRRLSFKLQLQLQVWHLFLHYMIFFVSVCLNLYAEKYCSRVY